MAWGVRGRPVQLEGSRAGILQSWCMRSASLESKEESDTEVEGVGHPASKVGSPRGETTGISFPRGRIQPAQQEIPAVQVAYSRALCPSHLLSMVHAAC